MSNEIKLSNAEKEGGKLAQILITAYAMEQIQGEPLKPLQVDQLFSEHMDAALRWRVETLPDRSGPLNLLDFALFTLFQLLGSIVSLSLMLGEADRLLPSYEKTKFALRVAGPTLAKQAGERMEKVLG
jgi:hypothetical protein